MQRKEQGVIQALDRVERFIDTNREVLVHVRSSGAYQNFSASRERVLEHMKAQNEHGRGARASVAAKALLRARLVEEHMRPIAVVARAHLPNAPELSAMAAPKAKEAYVRVVASGYGMARAAQLHEPVFLATGLPADFIQQLVAATDALQASLAARGERTGHRVRATAGLAAEGREARKHLRVLDTLVRAAGRGNEALLAEWRNIRRFAGRTSTAEVSEETPGTPGSPPSAAVTGAVTDSPREAPAAA